MIKASKVKLPKNAADFEARYDLAQIDPKNLKVAQKEINNISSNVIGKPMNTWAEIVKRFFARKIAVFALVLFLLVVAAAVIIPMRTIHDPVEPISTINTTVILNLPPSWLDGGNVIRINPDSTFLALLDNLGIKYEASGSGVSSQVVYSPYEYFGRNGGSSFSFLGTDSYGQDIWTRLWVGTRESLKLALLVAVVETILGVSLGAVIGFHAGSKFDLLVMRVVEIINSIPALIWFIIILFAMEPGFWSMFTALVVVGWLRPVATTRMFILRVKDAEYIKAAEAIGVSKAGRIFNHALLNILGKIMILFVQRIPMVIFAEATLAFLGLQADPTAATLGNVINSAKSHIDSWWYILSPTIVILTITLSLQMVSLGIHDAFDPKAGK